MLRKFINLSNDNLIKSLGQDNLKEQNQHHNVDLKILYLY